MAFHRRIFLVQFVFSAWTGLFMAFESIIYPLLLSLGAGVQAAQAYSNGLLTIGLLGSVVLFLAMFVVGRGLDLPSDLTGVVVTLTVGFFLGWLAGGLTAATVAAVLSPAQAFRILDYPGSLLGQVQLVAEALTGVVFPFGALSLGYFSAGENRGSAAA
jgi:hypothetical protein